MANIISTIVITTVAWALIVYLWLMYRLERKIKKDALEYRFDRIWNNIGKIERLYERQEERIVLLEAKGRKKR